VSRYKALKHRISRRDFLKSVAVTLGAAITSQTLAACSRQEPPLSPTQEQNQPSPSAQETNQTGTPTQEPSQITASPQEQNLPTGLPQEQSGLATSTPTPTEAPPDHTYYVRKDGSDTSGDGSTSAPWLTLSKALSVAGDRDLVKVGDGLYEENTGGVGYWNIEKALTDYLTIEAEAGAKGNVQVQGANHTVYNTLLRSGYIRFRYIQFMQRMPTNGSAFTVLPSSNVSHVVFGYCSFTVVADGTSISRGFIIDQNDNQTASHFTFTGCTFTVKEYSMGNHDGCRIGIAGTTGVVSNFTFTDCTANGRYGLYVIGAKDVIVDGGSYRGDYGAAICVGSDADSGGKASSVRIHNTAATTLKTYGHGVLIGNGAVNCIVDGLLVPECVNYSLVLKEHGAGGGTEVKNCDLQGGSLGALYCKAAAHANIHHNRIVGNQASSNGVFRVLGGDTGNKSDHVSFVDNQLTAPAGYAVEWGDATQDNGGGICDRNTYRLQGGKLAKIRGKLVSTLAEMQAAWSGYDVSGNDKSSVVIQE
jgi:hypothetical protein